MQWGRCIATLLPCNEMKELMHREPEIMMQLSNNSTWQRSRTSRLNPYAVRPSLPHANKTFSVTPPILPSMPLALQPQNSLSLHTLDNGKKTKHSNKHSLQKWKKMVISTIKKKEQNSINTHMHTHEDHMCLMNHFCKNFITITSAI